jgi:hypothetical protein
MVRALPTPPSGHPSLGRDGEQLHFSNNFPLLGGAGVGYKVSAFFTYPPRPNRLNADGLTHCQS